MNNLPDDFNSSAFDRAYGTEAFDDFRERVWCDVVEEAATTVINKGVLAAMLHDEQIDDAAQKVAQAVATYLKDKSPASLAAVGTVAVEAFSATFEKEAERRINKAIDDGEV